MKEQATKNLIDIKKILDELGITFWLDCGTFLGAYRDKDFCEGDEDDIDLGTWDNYLYIVPEIIRLAQDMGFEVYHQWELELALKRGGSKIDLFFNRKNKSDAYTHLYSGDRVEKYVVCPSRLLENLIDIEFKGEMFKAPNPEYLTLRYGDYSIKIPRSEYSCMNGEQNKLIRDTYEER